MKEKIKTEAWPAPQAYPDGAASGSVASNTGEISGFWTLHYGPIYLNPVGGDQPQT